MSTRFPSIGRIVASGTISKRFAHSIVWYAYTVALTVLESQNALVQLQLIEQIEISAWAGHVSLDNALHALLLQEVTLVVETVLIAQARQSFVDQ